MGAQQKYVIEVTEDLQAVRIERPNREESYRKALNVSVYLNALLVMLLIYSNLWRID